MRWLSGYFYRFNDSIIRTTVPLSTSFGLAATVPFKTLVTNRTAELPLSTAVISQGPLIEEPAKVSTTLPLEFKTIKQPALGGCRSPVTGRQTAHDHPACACSSTRAEVKPIPPGQAPGKPLAVIAGEETDFSTRRDLYDARAGALRVGAVISGIAYQHIPFDQRPGAHACTTATPYGLISPFAGTCYRRPG